MTEPLLPYWFWHAMTGSAGLLLLIVIALTGAVLRGRLQRPEGLNVFRVHRTASILFAALMLGAYVHGQHVTGGMRLALPITIHGWLGLAIVVLGIVQLLPSLLIRTRKSLRASHMVIGYLLAGLLFVQTFWGLQVGLVGQLKPLVLLHSLAGASAAIALIWVLIALRGQDQAAMLRARPAGYVAAFFNIAGCWIIGGHSYLTDYASRVKPVIVASAAPWAHQVLMETKEHVFIFIPTLSVLLALALMRAGRDEALAGDRDVRRSLVLLSWLVLLMVVLMFVLGALISSAGRIGAVGGP